jgi:hypothetical protein
VNYLINYLIITGDRLQGKAGVFGTLGNLPHLNGKERKWKWDGTG